MTFLVAPASATDPVDRCGSATVLSDLVLRGAGDRDSRQLTDYLDSLGLQRSSSVGIHHTRFGCAAVGPKVMESLATYADIVRRPHLPESGFEAARDLALQALAGIDDEPRQKLMIKLREWHFPSPYGRNTMGEEGAPGEADARLSKADFVDALSAARGDPGAGGEYRFRRRSRRKSSKHFGTGSRADARSDPAPAAAGQLSPRGSEERADAHRHRVSVDARNARGLLHACGWRSKCSAAG